MALSAQEQVAQTLAALGIKIPTGEGWEGLDETAGAAAKAAQSLERYNRAKIIADGVSDAALGMLHDMTIGGSAWQVHELGLLNAIGFGIMREGQNSLVRYIQDCKRIAAQGPGGDAVPSSRKRGTRK